MILGALAMLTANAAVLLGTHVLLDRVRTGKPSTDFTLFLLLRLLLISGVVLLAGTLRLLTAAGLGLAGVAALAALMAAGAHRRLPRFSLRGGGPIWTGVMAIVAVRLLLQVVFFAPYLSDSLGYHLPKIAEWVRSGGFTAELGPDLRSTFPAGFELVETWWVVFLHHDVLIEMAGVEFLVLAGAALHALSLGMGWTDRSARIAALAFVLGPTFYFQATSCVNDGAVAALVIATAALIVSQAPRTLILVPILLGAGVKPTFLYALPGLALMAALFPSRDGDAPLRSTAVACSAAAAAAGVGAWWYVRNWIVFGNPIYPMGPGGIRSATAGSTLQRLGPSLRALQENLDCLLDIRVYDALRAPDATATATAGWGVAAFAVGSTALVFLLRTEPLLRRVAAGLVVSLLCVFALVELDLWNMRFVVFFTALPALALGRFWERYAFVPALGTIALALQFAATLVPGNLAPEALSRMLGQRWTERASTPPPRDLPAGTTAYLCDDFGESYPLYGPSFANRVVYPREDTPEALLARLDREGVRVLYVSEAMNRRRSILEEGVRRHRLKPFDREGWKGYLVLPPG